MKKKIFLTIIIIIVFVVGVLIGIFAFDGNKETNNNESNSEIEEVNNYNKVTIENIFNNYGKELYDENITFSQYGKAIRNEFLKQYFLKNEFWTFDKIKKQLPKTNYSCHYVTGSIKDTNEGEIICSGGVTDNNRFTEYSVNLYFNEALYSYFKDNIENGRQFNKNELIKLGFKNLELPNSDVDISVIEEYWDYAVYGYYLGKDGYLYDYLCSLDNNDCSSKKASEFKLISIMQLDCIGKSSVSCGIHSVFIFENGDNMYDEGHKIILSKNDLENLRNS